MTTEELIKVIEVTAWIMHPIGLSISYQRTDSKLDFDIIIPKEETIRGLSAMACIDDYRLVDNEWIIEVNGTPYTWNNFALTYKSCQLEALTLAIFYESEKELANDMNMLELDSAINALK